MVRSIILCRTYFNTYPQARKIYHLLNNSPTTMNKRSCQYPLCFAWSEWPNESIINSRNGLLSSSIVEFLADTQFKCLYDKDKNNTDEIYVLCLVLEKTFHLGVNLTDTVKDVKNHIKRLEKIPTALMRLFLNDRLLKDQQTLDECGVRNKYSLMLGIKLHTAFCEKCSLINPDYDSRLYNISLQSIVGESLDVKVPLASTVEYMKHLIDHKYGIYPNNQLLVHKGKKLEDDVTLEEYGITQKSHLLFIPYQFDKCGFCSGCANANGRETIVLRFLDSKVVWALYPTHTVKMLKEISYQLLHHIHPDLQKVTFKRRELKDADTLEECGVHDKAKLKIIPMFNNRRCDKCNGPLV